MHKSHLFRVIYCQRASEGYLSVHTVGSGAQYEEGPTSVFPAPPLLFSLRCTGGHCQSWDALSADHQCHLICIYKPHTSFPMLDQKQCWWSKWMSVVGHLCSPRRPGASYINYSQHQKVSLGKESGSVLWNHYNDLKICSGVLLHNWGFPRNLTGLPRDHKKWEPIVSQLLAICCRFKTQEALLFVRLFSHKLHSLI